MSPENCHQPVLKVLNLKRSQSKVITCFVISRIFAVVNFLEKIKFHKIFLRQIVIIYSKFIVTMSFLQSVKE